MLVGDVISATVPWVKESPVIAPHVLRLTSAVACCHVGFLTGCTESPSSTTQCGLPFRDGAADLRRYAGLARPGQGLQDGLDLRISRAAGVLAQHADVLRRGRRRGYQPLVVDGGDEGGLPGRAGHGLGALVREAST